MLGAPTLTPRAADETLSSNCVLLLFFVTLWQEFPEMFQSPFLRNFSTVISVFSPVFCCGFIHQLCVFHFLLLVLCLCAGLFSCDRCKSSFCCLFVPVVMIFTAVGIACYSDGCICHDRVRLSVRPPSHSGVLSRRMKLRSCGFHRQVGQSS